MSAAAPLGEDVVVRLDGEIDLEGFKRAARSLLAGRVEPQHVVWRTAGAEQSDLLPGRSHAAGDTSAAVRVPPWFVEACTSVVLHRDPQRFALLYRLLWRLQREPGLRDDSLDADIVLARRMAQEVRRDVHKAKAFVRFREVHDGEDSENSGPLHVAWFEPGHRIVEAVAPFFARRFAQMRWAILTPQRSARWDGEQLHVGPGAKRDEAPPADAGEALWLAYYASVFNPARLKLATMQREMPRRYWHNLPEAELIAPLAAGAAECSGRMVEREPQPPARRMPSATMIEIRPDAVTTLDALRDATNRCRECPIGEFATQAVVGEGPLHAKLMLVGECPGDVEDIRGRPFVGPAGHLLDRALRELGWQRDQLYVTNAVKHFKYELRGKRRIHKTPAQREASACLHWLEDEIAMVQPERIVALGATAARSLMNRTVAVTKERGQWLEREDGRRVLITLHPSALLRVMEDNERERAYAQWLSDLSSALENRSAILE